MDRKIEYLPLDEEGLVCSEKDVFLSQEPERRTRIRLGFDEQGRMTDSMIWVCHGVLLSVSGILFFLSFASRYNVSYDLYHARHFSPYCKSLKECRLDSNRSDHV